MTEQIALLEWTPTKKPHRHIFGGETFDLVRDGKRLNAQLCRVHDCLIDGKKRTLEEISADTKDPPASVSARFRDLVAPNFPMRKEYVKRGLWNYWMETEGSK